MYKNKDLYNLTDTTTFKCTTHQSRLQLKYSALTFKYVINTTSALDYSQCFGIGHIILKGLPGGIGA